MIQFERNFVEILQKINDCEFVLKRLFDVLDESDVSPYAGYAQEGIENLRKLKDELVKKIGYSSDIYHVAAESLSPEDINYYKNFSGEKIRVLVFEPGKIPYIKEMNSILSNYALLLGGSVGYMYGAFDPVLLYCEENLEIFDSLYSRYGEAAYDYIGMQRIIHEEGDEQVYYGKVAFVDLDRHGKFRSCFEEQIDKLFNLNVSINNNDEFYRVGKSGYKPIPEDAFEDIETEEAAE